MLFALERALIELLLPVVSLEHMNAFLRSPQHSAIIVGSLIALCGALLGSYLLLRGMALTSDAISHTVLLGIVLAFLLMTQVLGLEGDTSSPWLILGAALAGMATVLLTEALQRSGLVKQDAALGLAFPLLFAIAIILVSRYVDDLHLDEDAVLVGEIGLAWANTNSHCFEGCQSLHIHPGHPLARYARQCSNCRELGINPRDARAVFHQVCSNCGDYSPAQAWSAGYLERAPRLVFFPRSITVMLLLSLASVGFVLAFYKELKLATFDPNLARALGLRPGALHYGLMLLVSLVAVGAFDAVGSILVIAFFILPPASAYLLSDRLRSMLLLSPLLGALGVIWGYDLARGQLLGVFVLDDALAALNPAFGLQLPERWDSSISACMVLMMFGIFVCVCLLSPRYGLLSTLLRRINRRRVFDEQVLLGHIYNHQGSSAQAVECRVSTLHEHFHWTQTKMQRVLTRLRVLGHVQIVQGCAELSERGLGRVQAFRRSMLGRL